MRSGPHSTDRSVSLDAFRGITIAGMILVNNPGSYMDVYGPLQHAVWNGWTPTDLIFPFFLFIVGVAVTMSIGPLAVASIGRVQIAGKVLRRAALIFGLGIFLNGFPLFDWSTLRIPGVLQRIALCYSGAALIVLTTDVRRQEFAAIGLILGYWMLMMLVRTPGGTGGELGPETNLAAYVDRHVLSGHLLHPGWDPEGLLSTLPALATTLFGVLTGSWLRSPRSPTERVAGLLIAGTAGVMLGLVMDNWFPINKGLWSSSYAVFSPGMALIVLGGCSWLIDCKGYRRWATPFVAYGMNPIVAYVLSSLTAKIMLLWTVTQADGSTVPVQQYLFAHMFSPLASPASASLLYAVAYVLMWLGIASLLYRRGIFIKI